MCYVCLLPSASFSPINQLDMKVVRAKTPQHYHQGEIRCFNFNFTIYRNDIKNIAPAACSETRVWWHIISSLYKTTYSRVCT